MIGAVVASVVLTCTLAVAGSAKTTLDPFDAHWLKATAQGSIYEVSVGKLALERGSGQACTIGQMLVDDHGTSLKETRSVAKQLGVKLPTRPNPLQQMLIAELSRANGTGFQQLFANLGVGDRRLDIEEARDTVKEGQNAKVKALARKEIPVLTMHLSSFVSLAKATTETTTSGTGTTTTSTPSSTTDAGSGCS
jgi:putative membrane protein